MRNIGLVSAADQMEGTAGRRSIQPFLSVILRTEEHHQSFLVDTLLSLAGQTSQDLKLLVMAHDMGIGSRIKRTFATSIHSVDALGGRGWSEEGVPGLFMCSCMSGAYVTWIDGKTANRFRSLGRDVQSGRLIGTGRVVRARVASQRIQPMMWDDAKDSSRRVE